MLWLDFVDSAAVEVVVDDPMEDMLALDELVNVGRMLIIVWVLKLVDVSVVVVVPMLSLVLVVPPIAVLVTAPDEKRVLTTVIVGESSEP